MALKRLLRFLATGLAALSLASSASAQSLKVQFRPSWISTNDNQLALTLNVVNTGSSAVTLSTVTVRYYFTREGSASLTAFCDYTPRGCSNVTTSFGTVSPAATTADSYVQIGFGSGAGSLSAGQSTGDIQLRVAKTDWSAFNETNDYSYAGNASLTDSPNITAFVSGTLVWGTAPGGTTTQDFALAASPVTLTVARSASGTSTINVTRTNFTTALSCSASGLPTGVTASFSPASVTGNSTVLTLAASATATTGAATVTVTCTGGTLSRTTTIALTVGTTTQNFTLAASPATLTVARSASGTSTINVTRTSFTSTLTCSASGLPGGVTASFSPASVTGNSTVLTLAASATATTGAATVTVTCTGGGLSRTTTIALTVGTTTQNFTLAASPATVSVAAGSSAVTTISITRTSFTSAVALTASGLPAGVTATFTPASATGTSSNLSLAAASTAAATTATVTVTGTGGGLTRTTTIALTVTTSTGNRSVWRVNANGRLTRNGSLFQFHCGSWFGLQGRYEIASDSANPRGAPMEQYIGNTFWANGGSGTGRTIAKDFQEMKQGGITVVRLPLVHQTLDASDPQGTNFLKNHSSVRIANSRLALETMIKEAATAGVYLLLDVHSCSNYIDWRAGRFDAKPPWADATRENYDYKREDCSCTASGNPSSVTRVQAYNSTLWLQDLRTIAGLNQALGVDSVMGIDLFNEPWDYSWTEWRGFVEQGYAAINGVDSNLLVFVQGISGAHGHDTGNQQPEPFGASTTKCANSGATTGCSVNPNWGENLYGARADPPNVPKDRLVFSPHTYGPSVFVQMHFMDPAQSACSGLEGDAAAAAQCNIVINPTLLKQGWEEHFGYLKDQGYAVIVGEWGGNPQWPKGKASLRDQQMWSYLTSTNTDLLWQQAFTDYMVEKGIESCYWSINPESGDTGGWYSTPYDPNSNTGGWGEWGSFDSTRTQLLNKVWNGIR